MAEFENLKHEAVLREEAVSALLPDGCASAGCVVDATFGAGGHSRQILETISPECRLLAIDCDEYAAACAATIGHSNFHFARGNFSDLSTVLCQYEIDDVFAVLFDLGMSSMQLDTAARGFSFQRDGDLDMRMDRRYGRSATQWLQESSEDTICQALKRYGEEPEARRIARALFAARQTIKRTSVLAELVCATKRQPTPAGKHPATRVFQALRIAVNDELGKLQRGLEAACQALLVGGRLVVIAFHSLEDRLVKNFAAGDAFPNFGRLYHNALRPVGRVRRSSAAEIAANPRARSACLRVFVKVAIS